MLNPVVSTDDRSFPNSKITVSSHGEGRTTNNEMVEPLRNDFVVTTYKPTKGVEPEKLLRKMYTSTAFPRQGITDPSSLFRRKRTARSER